jgi:hypothetical protein
MFYFDDQETLPSMTLTKATNNDRLIEQSCETIEGLYEKYANDLYMISKIHHYISHQLPNLLENLKQMREKSIRRAEDHTIEQEKFITTYLNAHRYYYLSISEMYFSYDGKHYTQTTEDDILHHIVSSISEDRNPMLMNWKHKTKVSVLRKIKDQTLLKTIPESFTIQRVIQLLQPYVCASKSEAKYFLTIIGDNILKKNCGKIHYIPLNMKDFLQELNQASLDVFHVQCVQTFKYKYHEKHLETIEECRIVPCSKLNNVDFVSSSALKQSLLDILCVSVHYSHKYETSDEYILERNLDAELQQFIFSLKKNTPVQIMNQFTRENILNYSENVHSQVSLISSSPQEETFLLGQSQDDLKEVVRLSWTDIQYLWKEFLKNHHYPPILFQNIFRKNFIEQYSREYDSETDTFRSLGSSQLPLIQKFLKFWKETTFEEESDLGELEIEEVATLFRQWLNANKSSSSKSKQKHWLKESKILDILTYFHPELEIKDQKYILNVSNILWSKELDIENAITAWKEANPEFNVENEKPSFCLDELYGYYCKFYRTPNSGVKNNLVSKSYFQKYVNHRME